MGFVGQAAQAITNPMGALQGISKGLTVQNGFQGQGLAGTGNYTQQNFLDAIQQAQNQYNTNAQGQNALATQLQAQANGQGPNLAAGQLEQGTNANIAKNASMIAATKGISPALAAHDAAMSAANSNQEAAGQAAQLRQTQQLNAQNSLNNLYNTVGNQSVSQQGMLQGANTNQNSQLVNQNLSLQGLNASAASQNAQNTQQTQQGILGGISKVASLAFSRGGVVPFHEALAKKYADGGGVDVQFQNPFPWMNNTGGGSKSGGISDLASSLGPLVMAASHGGKVPAMVSPGEIYLDPSGVQAVEHGANPLEVGERVPGKAKVKGDSSKNDFVRANLDVGGEVIKRTKANDPEKAAEFVKALKEKNTKKGYGSVLEARRHFEEGMKHLNALKGAS